MQCKVSGFVLFFFPLSAAPLPHFRICRRRLAPFTIASQLFFCRSFFFALSPFYSFPHCDRVSLLRVDPLAQPVIFVHIFSSRPLFPHRFYGPTPLPRTPFLPPCLDYPLPALSPKAMQWNSSSLNPKLDPIGRSIYSCRSFPLLPPLGSSSRDYLTLFFTPVMFVVFPPPSDNRGKLFCHPDLPEGVSLGIFTFGLMSFPSQGS